ncbi:histone H2A deubiquitinase MYSM1-like [Gigantopelta aegis]|uniref:histone H2A deubiquitinase MYSM1-like n=1 Tax=Gigantopelta aegis TaxID=1735272 RepID=UPI001B88E128|nr:histone H2A deubiquitinase MYSM1-like [Gigantopelta aegis]
MADDGEIDIEGEFDFKLEVEDGFYDANELPSASANLLPEYTNPPWMLEQGWTLDMDEKSKATIERMLLEEQQYLNTRTSKSKLSPLVSPCASPVKAKSASKKPRPWTEDEKKLFLKGLDMHGRSWTRISELIPSRTNLQVKNYAQQYFKNLAKKAECNESSSYGPQTVHPRFLSLAEALASVTTARPTVAPSNKTQTKCTPVKQYKRKKKAKIVPDNNMLIGSALSKDVEDRSWPKSDMDFMPKLTGIDTILASSEILDGSSSFEDLNAIPFNGVVGNYEVIETEQLDRVHSSIFNINNKLDDEKLMSSGDSGISDAPRELQECDSDVDVDIDIENDDGTDNLILQSRSASPSSVYETLLKAANVPIVSVVVKQETESNHSDICSESSIQSPMCEVEVDTKDDVKREDNHDSDVDNNTSLLKSEPRSGLDACEAHSPDSDSTGVPNNEENVVVNGITLSSGEVIEFPIPMIEKYLIYNEITEEEQKVHSQFFDGRPSKTPDRYLKIRNHILECWNKCKPNFLNKTSVRSGLKNCGDVNCIGRIHAYLECIGAINIGCEQAAYNNTGKGTSCTGKTKTYIKDDFSTVFTEKFETIRPRKRRIRDQFGEWVDEKELEGKTIEHKTNVNGETRTKLSRNIKLAYDPFKLLPCLPFTEDSPAPFSVAMFNTALAVMDTHAHISKTEVIGLLGGDYHDDTHQLTIAMAVPCNSLSTGMQCEMDPVSQTQASEKITQAGLMTVGWYHSHPTFAPNPSVRDVETQLKFQDWFAKGGSHFVGIIISPYSRSNRDFMSEIQCLTMSRNISAETSHHIPYKFDYSVIYKNNDENEFLMPAKELAEKYSASQNRVSLCEQFGSSFGITCLDKMLHSIRQRLFPQDEPADEDYSYQDYVLQLVKEIFMNTFSNCYQYEDELVEMEIVNDCDIVVETDVLIDNCVGLNEVSIPDV